jgi:hypothetical protein
LKKHATEVQQLLESFYGRHTPPCYVTLLELHEQYPEQLFFWRHAETGCVYFAINKRKIPTVPTNIMRSIFRRIQDCKSLTVVNEKRSRSKEMFGYAIYKFVVK